MRRNQRALSQEIQEKNKKPKNDGFIRLISGQWKGKKLPVKDKQGLRPTTDRTKETLFNWLMHDVRDANCLDCFSGSGSLGFEALSRYANFCTFLELDKQIAIQLKNNMNALKANNAEVLQVDSLLHLTSPAQKQYNLVFIDPPFNKSLAQPCIDQLSSKGHLADDCLIYLEVENTLKELSIPDNWELLKEKQSSQVRYQLFYKRL